MLAGLETLLDASWLRIRSPVEPPHEITGMYLFFSPDRDVLLRVAAAEIRSHNFHHAKINFTKLSAQPDHVLCLYYADDSRKRELAERYASTPNLRYRYW
jgi:hypothetical protein